MNDKFWRARNGLKRIEMSDNTGIGVSSFHRRFAHSAKYKNQLSETRSFNASLQQRALVLLTRKTTRASK